MPSITTGYYLPLCSKTDNNKEKSQTSIHFAMAVWFCGVVSACM
jgi:hypothetical protein